jgi:hypothetical protein
MMDHTFLSFLTPEEKTKFLQWYAENSLMPYDFILSLYTVLQDDLFFVLFLFSGLSLDFIPGHRIENYFKEREKEKRNGY